MPYLPEHYSIEPADKIRPRRQKEYFNRKLSQKRERYLLLLSHLAILSSIAPPDLEIVSGYVSVYAFTKMPYLTLSNWLVSKD